MPMHCTSNRNRRYLSRKAQFAELIADCERRILSENQSTSVLRIDLQFVKPGLIIGSVDGTKEPITRLLWEIFGIVLFVMLLPSCFYMQPCIRNKRLVSIVNNISLVFMPQNYSSDFSLILCANMHNNGMVGWNGKERLNDSIADLRCQSSFWRRHFQQLCCGCPSRFVPAAQDTCEAATCSLSFLLVFCLIRFQVWKVRSDVSVMNWWQTKVLISFVSRSWFPDSQTLPSLRIGVDSASPQLWSSHGKDEFSQNRNRLHCSKVSWAWESCLSVFLLSWFNPSVDAKWSPILTLRSTFMTQRVSRW